MITKIYTKSGCDRCESLKKFLTYAKISFIELKLGDDITREYLLQRFPGVEEVPIILVDDTLIGTLEETIDYFKMKGYGHGFGSSKRTPQGN